MKKHFNDLMYTMPIIIMISIEMFSQIFLGFLSVIFIIIPCVIIGFCLTPFVGLWKLKKTISGVVQW